jgi:hypothetical protein
MKKMLLLVTFAAMLGLSSQANAGKVMFGQQDSIHFVANTTITGPGGTHLFLGHLVTMQAFLLPYYVESKGLVFGISGESKKYIPLPAEQQLIELKNAGLLPKDLPTPELSIFDYVFGFSLELLVLVAVGYPVLKSRFSKKNG